MRASDWEAKACQQKEQKLDHSTSALPLASTKQLFLDSPIVDSLVGVRLVLNSANKFSGNPTLVADRPWEGRMVFLNGTVLWDEDEKVFKMWYQAAYGNEESLVCYALSKDGKSWDKPALNSVSYGGNTRNNIVLRNFGKGDIWHPSVIKDSQDPDPSKRYKMIYWNEPKPRQNNPWAAVCAAFSSDGIRWQNALGNPIWSGVPPGDVLNCIYDQERSVYLLFHREYPHGKRVVALSESTDFLHWSPRGIIVSPEATDPEWLQFYGMSGFRYEDTYVGFLWNYNARSDLETIDIRLTTSRDGITWKRILPESVFLSLGEERRFDGGMVFTANHPIIVGEEIFVYYGGWACRHDVVPPTRAAIGLATLRRDGFVGLAAGEKEGTLTTKPFTFEGDELILNAESAQGLVEAALLHPDGTPLSGFNRSDCFPLNANGLSSRVQWKRNPSFSPLQGKPIRLKFYLQNAKLYCFQFRRGQKS